MGLPRGSRRGETWDAASRTCALATAALASALALNGCSSCGHAGPVDRAALGAMANVDAVDFAPYLAIAHALVAHAPPPATSPPPAPGDRVFVTAWMPGKPPVRATGLGATLLDGVVAASEEIAKTATASANVRVEIDALTTAQSVKLDSRLRDRIFDVGLHGYAVSDGAARIGWVLPSEILLDGDVELGGAEKDRETRPLHSEKLAADLAARAHVEMPVIASMNAAQFEITARVEPAVAGGAPVPLFRTMPPHPTTLTPDALLAAVRAAADYLARIVDRRGAFTYQYDPVHDQRSGGYSILRHAGAIYALMEAYEELHVLEWEQATARAVGYLKQQLQHSPDGAFLSDNPDGEQRKSGGSGIAIVALVKYAQATGDASDLETMRDLARFIVHQQYDDGHFRENADVTREDDRARGKRLNKEIYYFAGEATLGLTRLYTLDPDPKWLAAARKSADYIVNVRDAHDDLKHQIHDHWLSYALHDLFVITREPSYAAHAHKIADAILLAERKPDTAPYPDYVGSFYDEGQTTPTSTRLEALASTFQLARFMGTDETPLATASMQLACFMRGQQLDAESVYFVKDPSRAMGGVRESLMNSDVRIDYPQHALSAWLRVARLLRDPAWGKPGK